MIALSGCHGSFQPNNFANPEALYSASLAQFQAKHWANASAGFERLSNDLSARDPLLPSVLFYLARAHENQGENLLAAQAFQRISDSYPDDTLGPMAMLGEGAQLSKAVAQAIARCGTRAARRYDVPSAAGNVSNREGSRRCEAKHRHARELVREKGL